MIYVTFRETVAEMNIKGKGTACLESFKRGVCSGRARTLVFVDTLSFVPSEGSETSACQQLTPAYFIAVILASRCRAYRYYRITQDVAATASITISVHRFEC